MKFILGKKVEMTQIFDEKDRVIPVTIIKAGHCDVLQIKTKEKDGYEAFQIGFEKIEKKKKIKKPQKTKPYKFIREFRITGDTVCNLKQGDRIDVSIFKEGDLVKISGISKGKGFQGAVKRWGFAGKNKTHGTKHEERTLGSVGAAWPERVIKGKKMPGRMGQDRTTIKNSKVIKIDAENNLLAVKGAVPGSRGTLLEIKKT